MSGPPMDSARCAWWCIGYAEGAFSSIREAIARGDLKDADRIAADAARRIDEWTRPHLPSAKSIAAPSS